MPLDKDLIGIGMPDGLGRRVGLPANLAVTAAGSASTDATVLGTQTKVVTMTATGADGIRFNSNMPLNTMHIVYNSSGSTGIVYPPTGGAINGGSTDAGLSLATKKVAFFYRLSTNVVVSVLTA